MIIDPDFLTIGGAICAVAGAFWAAVWKLGQMWLKQMTTRLDERFAAMEHARAESGKHWDTKFRNLEQSAEGIENEWRRIERDVLTLKADLPLHYVRREDYVRNQTVIEAKIDGLAIKLENILLRGGPSG